MRVSAKKLDEVVNWRALGAIGKHSAVRSAYFWMIAVPIAARLLSKFEREYLLTVFGAELHLIIALPFSWKVFYFSSVFIAAGTTIYALWCPSIIKRFRDFSGFEAEGKSEFLIVDAMSSHKEFHRGGDAQSEFRRRFCRHIDPFDDTIPDREKDFDHIEERCFADAFHFARQSVSRWHPFARWTCGALYAVGFSLLSWVFVDTLWFVIQFVSER